MMKFLASIVCFLLVAIIKAEAQPLPFEVCAAASLDPGGVRCVQSVGQDGRQYANVQIPANSFHIISVKPLFRRDVKVQLNCFYRSTISGVDESATSIDGTMCPSEIGKSHHIKTISLGLAGADVGNYILAYRCWTSKFGDTTKTEQPRRIWYGPSSGPEPCGVVAENNWISGVEIYTYGFPKFP
jgi:hypothetical protein